jgi:hypothetical protein
MNQDIHRFDVANESSSTAAAAPLLEEASRPFVGRWNQLVSTTNWEKGRIIADWRQALIDADAPAVEYSDEAWARLVGGVTGQHVGRLRRVYQRFAGAAAEYPGLYWTHFHAALDWDDAELWLEGAKQSRWSVSQMRRQRWEAMGAIEQDQPHDAEIVSNELDEDFEPARSQEPMPSRLRGELAEVQGPLHEGPDFGDESAPGDVDDDGDREGFFTGEDAPAALVRPFENLPELPIDLAEAFEQFKLSILRHKATGWEQVSRDDVLASLDALKALTLAASAE